MKNSGKWCPLLHRAESEVRLWSVVNSSDTWGRSYEGFIRNKISVAKSAASLTENRAKAELNFNITVKWSKGVLK